MTHLSYFALIANKGAKKFYLLIFYLDAFDLIYFIYYFIIIIAICKASYKGRAYINNQ